MGGSPEGTLASAAVSAQRRTQAAIRWGRLVRIWNRCWGHWPITSQTRAMNPSGTPGWNRSDMESTKYVVGRRRRSGTSRRSGRQRTSPVQSSGAEAVTRPA